jgi:hypothetical protein
MRLVEYIYVDDARINSYAQQANLSSFLRKFPNWLTEISLAGAKININRSSTLNDQSRYEKICKIIRFMKDEDEILEGRPNWQGEDSPDYWIENCSATRAYFQSDVSPELAFSIWISEENDCEVSSLIQNSSNHSSTSGKNTQPPAKLLLLENLEPKDLNYQKRISSPYSVLQALGTVLQQKLPAYNYNHLHSGKGLHKELATNPLETLKLIGAEIYEKRKISVFYKIRHLFPEYYTPNYQFAAIAYPLFIADNRQGKNLTIDDFLESRSRTKIKQVF